MSFFEFTIAKSGLFAAQRGLQVTSNNITNATTTGHSRQVLSQKAATPLGGFIPGMRGTGVETTGVNRIRDSYIDNKLWTQNPKLGEYNIKVTQNSIIESAFGEPSEQGFTKVFNNMFNAMSTLSTNPSSKDTKAVLKEEMTSYTKYFNNIAGTLEKQQNDLNFQIKELVKEVNMIGKRIQSLNQQIFEAELYGNEASSFRDQRDLCIDRLSQIVNTEVREEEVNVNGNIVKHCKVEVAGQIFVDHYNVTNLEVKVRTTPQNERDVPGLYDIVWNSGADFKETDVNLSGELKGLIDMRDGGGTGAPNSYNGIPYYLERLDKNVRTFAQAMNDQYSRDKDGYVEIQSMPSSPTIATTVNCIKLDEKGKVEGCYFVDGAGVKTDVLAGLSADERKEVLAYVQENHVSTKALFSYSTGSSSGEIKETAGLQYKDMNATNFSISKEMYEDPFNMRFHYEGDDVSGTKFLLNLVAQKDNVNMFAEGDPKDYMIAIFAELGINASEAEMYQNTQEAVTKNLINQRLAVSQVDITEEFTYLIQYQQAYQASAKIMTTIDSIYETTIFKLGNF